MATVKASMISIDGSPAHNGCHSTPSAFHPPPPPQQKKKPQSDRHISALNDTFPAKTHHLVTQITETDPQVVTFSPDGSAFYIYDQTIFAQKYLPQYFKHNNYGSFVRQLNLYGFTSSRLKWNIDVIVWTHDFFHRDRVEDVCKIKRAKNKGRAAGGTNKPPPVPRDVPRLPSTSVSDDGESLSHSFGPGTRRDDGQEFLRQFLKDVESEFAYLKQQNRFLEEKLDILLKITLNPGNGYQSGEKRRRFEGHNDYAYSHSSHYGESKYSEDEKYSDYEPLPYSTADSGRLYRVGARGQLKSVTEFPPAPQPVRRKRNSFTEFVDVMLTEEDKVNLAAEFQEPNRGGNFHDERALAAVSSKHVSRMPPQEVQQEHEALHDNDFQEELITEDVEAFLQQTLNEDQDLFSSSFDMNEDPPLSTNGARYNVQPTEFAMMVHRSVDKSSGPEPILSTDVVVGHSEDLEEGNNVPVGVAVISARAEIVEENVEAFDGANNVALQQELDRARQQKKTRRRVIYILSFILVALTVTFISWPVTRMQKHEKEEMATIEADKKEIIATVVNTEGQTSSDDSSRHESGLFDDEDDFPTNTTTAQFDSSGPAERPFKDDDISAQTRSALLPDTLQRDPGPSSFSVTIAGAEFSCLQSIPL